MFRRFPMPLLPLLALVLAGCRTPPLASRPMTPTEAEWASAIQRGYPGWRPPFLMPTREGWERRQPRAPEPPRPPAGVPPVPEPTPTAPAPPPEPARQETVIEIQLPELSKPAEDGSPASRPVAEPVIDDVDFVPAE